MANLQGQSIKGYTDVQVFSSTVVKARDNMGVLISDWIASMPEIEIVDTVVTQSSDSEFHCLSITVFYKRTGS